ncbi:MAG: hypothetical protein EG828_03855 [Deltaproteobacteria bacterium]|nr:hypothetical protein [Deltaproteobacteria bacterium]
MGNLSEFESIAEAAEGVFRPTAEGGLGENYRRFEIEIHRALARQLKKLAPEDNWLREVAKDDKLSTGKGNMSVDFALVGKEDDRTRIKALLEVKVVEQYRSNRRHGHEFPFLFYNADLADGGLITDLIMRLRLNELGREDTPKNRERIVESLRRVAPMQALSNEIRFCYADEGALLYDLTKMISYAERESVPLYQLIYVLTYTDAPYKNWEHVHDSGYLGKQLHTLYSRFHDLSRKSSSFEVYNRDGEPAIRSEFRPFATKAEHKYLGARHWKKSEKDVERNISMVLMRHDLDPALPFSFKGDDRTLRKEEETLRYGVFDVETKHSAKEVGGWGNAQKMGVSIAVLYDSAIDQFLVYREEEVPAMIERMKGLDLVIGFNNKRFDNKVLSAYTSFDLDILPTLDLYQAAGRQGGLDNYAKHTLNAAKSGNGLDAIHWFKEGRFDKIAEYCKKDVELTKGLYEYAKKNGRLRCEGKDGKVIYREVRV